MFARFGVYVIAWCMLCLSNSALHAASLDELTMNVGFGLNINQHKAGFVSLPVYTNQFAAYNNASSTSYHLSAGLNYFPSQHWGIGGRVAYTMLGATLSSTEFIGNQELSGQLIPITTIHNLQTTLATLSLQSEVLYRPLLRLPLCLSLGLNYGFFVTKNFTQTETLSQQAIDAGFRFVDQNGQQTTVREKGSGALPSVKPYQAIVIGAGYDIALGQHLRLGLDLGYALNMAEIVQGTGWKINQTQAGVRLAYSLRSTLLPEPPQEPDTVGDEPAIADSSALSAAAKQHDNENPQVRDSVAVKIGADTVRNTLTTHSTVEDTVAKKHTVGPDSTQLNPNVEFSSRDSLLGNTSHEVADNAAARPDSLVDDTGETVNTWIGCVIILSSTESASRARTIAREAERVGVDSLTVVPWFDKNDRTRYYRVQRPLHRYDELHQVRVKLEAVSVRYRKYLAPVLKCN